MKKNLLFLVCALLSISFKATAQPTNRSLDNFYVDQQKQEMHYENVFTDSLDNAAKITRKVYTVLSADTGEISSLVYDSTYNMYTGRIKNMHIPYYSKGSGKGLVAKFTLEIKDGRYKVTIRDMMWQSDYLSFSTERNYVEDATINDKATEWKSAAFDILPQLNDVFIDTFKLPVPKAGSAW